MAEGVAQTCRVHAISSAEKRVIKAKEKKKEKKSPNPQQL